MTPRNGSPGAGGSQIEDAGWWNSLEHFETEAKAIAEDATRIDAARCTAMGMFYCDDCACSIPRIPGFDEDAVIDLIDRLESLGSWLCGGSLASYGYMREVRQHLLQSVYDAFENYPDEAVATATVIKRTWAFAPEQLIEQTAAAIKNQFLTDLKRAGIASMPGPLIAFLHGEFEPSAGLYVLHWHVLSTQEKAKALHGLKYDGKKRFKGYVKTHTGAAPIVVDPVRDRVRQFSYLLKSFWLENAVRDDVRSRDGNRIREPYHTLYLTWLDRQLLKDITIMNGVWSRRKGGTESMKQLYFKVFG